MEHFMKYKSLAVLLLVALPLSACAKKQPYDASTDVFLIEDTHVTVGMVNTLFYAFEQQENEQNQPLYGDQFWELQCFEDPDMSYGVYEKEYIFYEDLMNMFCLSALWQQEHELTEDQEEMLAKGVTDYMAGLDEQTKTLLSVSDQEVLTLYRTYYTARLMQQEIEEGMDSVISQEEIRVVTVFEAYFDDLQTAEEYIAGLEEGQDAEALAVTASSYTQENCSRDDISDSDVQSAIFSLKEGAHTEVLPTEQGYLVAVLLDAFQEELSESRRQELLQDRRQEAVADACEDYRATAQIYISQELWGGYSFQAEELPEGVGDIYELFLQGE
jgi:hypothetical protein